LNFERLLLVFVFLGRVSADLAQPLVGRNLPDALIIKELPVRKVVY
jgi:hypothetical protein